MILCLNDNAPQYIVSAIKEVHYKLNYWLNIDLHVLISKSLSESEVFLMSFPWLVC